ncbi:MAG: VWA domain-containing protein [Planctomycetota bacterium]|nr:VWA domain-containing protein [Planctomycetota bacterium]
MRPCRRTGAQAGVAIVAALVLWACVRVSAAAVPSDPASAQPEAPEAVPGADSLPADVPSPADAAPTPGAAPTVPLTPVMREAVERLVVHYLDMYGKHLKSDDWMARAMAVIGLAQIDDPRITQVLFEVLDTDKLPLVRVYAWEALHSRLKSLDADQRGRWLEAGQSLLAKGHLRGDLRAGLVRAVAPAGPTDENRRLFRGLFAETNSMDSSDMRTLLAMRQVLAQWCDRALITDLVGTMGQLNCVFRAEYVLGDLPWSVPVAAKTFAEEGTDALCLRTHGLWKEALAKAPDEAFKPRPVEPYTGPSPVLPAAQAIANPGDPKWRKELELTRFTLDHLDVTLAVDSTGSMTSVIRWIQRDVTKLMRAFYLISYEPRLSMVFYRDHGDAYVTKAVPFTSNADVLSRAIRGIEAKGGGDLPEAVYDALVTALSKQIWSSGQYAQRIVVVIGDAPPHPQTMTDIQKMVVTAAEKQFQFFCLKVRSRYTAGTLTEFDQIADWGKGQSFWAEFRNEMFPELESLDVAGRDFRGAQAKTWRSSTFFGEVAQPTPSDGPYRQLVQAIVRTAIPPSYRDKTGPFVNTLLEYLETPVPERRQPFAPYKPEKTGGTRKQHRVDAPFDPQAR